MIDFFNESKEIGRYELPPNDGIPKYTPDDQLTILKKAYFYAVEYNLLSIQELLIMHIKMLGGDVVGDSIVELGDNDPYSKADVIQEALNFLHGV